MRLGSDSLILTQSKDTFYTGFLSKSCNADLHISLKVIATNGLVYLIHLFLAYIIVNRMCSLQQQLAKIKLKMINKKLPGNDSSTRRIDV